MNQQSGVGIKWAALLTAAFVIQVALASQIDIFGVHPELMLLVAIVAGLVSGPERGAGVGFAAGFLVDLTLHGTFGMSAFAFTVVGFLVGSVKEAILRISSILAVLITLLASALGVLLYATVAHLLGDRTLSDPKLSAIVTIVSVWNAVLCIPMLWLARRVEGTRAAF